MGIMATAWKCMCQTIREEEAGTEVKTSAITADSGRIMEA